jgi:hypothetical protein
LRAAQTVGWPVVALGWFERGVLGRSLPQRKQLRMTRRLWRLPSGQLCLVVYSGASPASITAITKYKEVLKRARIPQPIVCLRLHRVTELAGRHTATWHPSRTPRPASNCITSAIPPPAFSASVTYPIYLYPSYESRW